MSLTLIVGHSGWHVCIGGGGGSSLARHCHPEGFWDQLPLDAGLDEVQVGLGFCFFSGTLPVFSPEIQGTG